MEYNGLSARMEVRNAPLTPDSSALRLSSLPALKNNSIQLFVCVSDNGVCLDSHALQAPGHNKSPTDSLFSDYSHKVSKQAFL